MTATSLVGHGRPPAVPRPDVQWAWRSGPCAALEHRFELLVEPEDFGSDLDQLVAPFRTRRPPEDSAVVVSYSVRADGDGDLPLNLYVDDEHLMSGATARIFSGILAWHINRSAVEASEERHVLLHASAATRAGMTIILPADMESGKTTTIAGLLRSGFDYVTDEAVAIDPATGRITPFPKTLSLDPGSWGLFPECRPATEERVLQWHVDPGQFGARTIRTSVGPPRFVVFPKYVAGAETTMTPVPPAEAVSELARMSFHFARHPRRNLMVVKQVALNATLARLVIGSLDDAVQAIEELISHQLWEKL